MSSKITYQRARRTYRCQAGAPVAECTGHINRGEMYERWLAFPNHDYAGDWWTCRICERCEPKAIQAREAKAERRRQEAGL